MESVWTVQSGTRDGYEEYGSGGPNIESVWSSEELAKKQLNHLAEYWKYRTPAKPTDTLKEQIANGNEEYRISPCGQRYITLCEYDLDPPQ